jgi:hypothetical protein
MSAKVDRFCDGLRDRLNAIEGWLESVKTHIQSLPERVREDLRNKLEAARAKLQAQKERVERTRSDLKFLPWPDVSETLGPVIEWKAERPVGEPGAYADPAGARAADSIDQALAGIDEVEGAILYAAVARLHDSAR